MHSLDQFIVSPAISAILSQLMLFGCDAIGLMLLHVFGFSLLHFRQWQRWQAPIVGAMGLGIILYPLALAGLTPLLLMRCIAFACTAVGLVHMARLIYRFNATEKYYSDWVTADKMNKWFLLIPLLMIGIWLLALGPVTDADSLDYHIGIPIELLNSGRMPFVPEWFHGRLAGNGEVLNALGLSMGAEQFGSLLQFAGLMGIAGLFLYAEQEDAGKEDTRAMRGRCFVIALAAISAPVLVALINPKPQLLPIGMTTLAFALLIYPSQRQLSRNDAIKRFALICLLIMYASQAKLTYMLGGGVVGLCSLTVMAKKKLLMPALGVAVLAILLIVLPPVLWKYSRFHSGIIEALIKPLPGNWPGTDAFEAYLRSFRDSPVPFPLSLIIPSGIGTITTVIGIGFILLIGLRPRHNPWLWTGICMAVFVALAAVLLGPKSSRSYLEPYFWLLMILALQPEHHFFSSNKPIRYLVITQGVLTLVLCLYGIATLVPGVITQQWRSRVMTRTANGYTILNWADSVLPVHAVLLNGHRSMALMPRASFSLDWLNYVDVTSQDAVVYLQRLKDKGITHILIIGKPSHNFDKLSPCVGEIVAGPHYGHLATRNPFNLGELYEGRIYKFNPKRLPDVGH